MEFFNQEIASLKLESPLLVSVQPTSTIGSVLEVLKKHNITSVPIQSHHNNEKGGQSFMAIINVFDIICYILRTGRFDHDIESALSLQSDAESFLLQEVVGFDTLKTVMTHLTKVHRLLVVEKKRQFLISQTDIIRYLSLHSSNDALLNKSLRQVLHKRDIVFIPDTFTAKQGFEKMQSSRHLALPIVNKDGTFIHVLSNADLRGIDETTFNQLNLNVIDYLKKINKQQPKTAVTTTTVKELMRLSVENLAHRTFILDEKEVVCNVISLTDLIKLFLQ